MCGRFETSHLSWAQIHDQLSRFGTVRPTNHTIEPNDDVRPTTQQVFFRREGDDWIVERGRWGLVPFWRSGKPLKDTAKGAGDGFKLSTFNARCEGVASASTFRDAFKRRRCIVPASAWFEWTGPAGSKVKHTFRRADGEPIWFVGIWDQATTTDAGPITSFTLLTGPSSGWLADYHDRAPVILEPEEWPLWFDLERQDTDLGPALRPDRFWKAA